MEEKMDLIKKANELMAEVAPNVQRLKPYWYGNFFEAAILYIEAEEYKAAGDAIVDWVIKNPHTTYAGYMGAWEAHHGGPDRIFMRVVGIQQAIDFYVLSGLDKEGIEEIIEDREKELPKKQLLSFYRILGNSEDEVREKLCDIPADKLDEYLEEFSCWIKVDFHIQDGNPHYDKFPDTELGMQRKIHKKFAEIVGGCEIGGK